MRPGDHQRRVTQGKASVEPASVRARIAELRPDKYHWDQRDTIAMWVVVLAMALGAAALIWL